MKIVALTFAFLLEVFAIFAYAFSGLSSSLPFLQTLLVGFALPFTLIAFWGTWMAPKSKRRLQQPLYGIVKAAIFSGAVLALFLASQQFLGIIFLLLWVIDEALLYVTGESRPHEMTD